MTLRLSDELTLPLDTVTKTLAILAKRRVGKTYTAAVLAEEMVAAGLPFYALDPTGAWWGLRAAANGRDAGLPVIVLGGEHGDVPIDHTAGKAVADLVVDQPGFYVIDLSDIDEIHSNTVRFCTAFLDRLYRRKAKDRDPLHGFWDEADFYAPQRPGPDETRMLGAAESIVRRGGIRGLGTTLITQRPATLNKNVLTQIDIGIFLRVTGPQDRKALSDYLEGEADTDLRREVLDSLAGLGLGEAWVFGPGEDPMLYQRIRVRERRTFNSSATPKPGEQRIEPARLADIDIDALRDRMAESVEKAKADDPKMLRKRIGELERHLAERPEAQPPAVEVPAVDASMAEQFVASVDALEGLAGDLDNGLAAAMSAARTVRDEITLKVDALGEVAAAIRGALAVKNPSRHPPERAPSSPSPPRSAGAPADATLKKVERSILTVLAQYPQGRTTTQVAILAGYSKNGGGFRNGLGSLRTRGFISPAGHEPLVATQTGVQAAGDVEPLPLGRALLDHWITLLKKAEREVLEVLYDAYPTALTAEEIAARTPSEYAPSGGGFRNALGKLRTLELAEGRATIRASEALFS